MIILTLVVSIYGVEKYIHKFLDTLEPQLRFDVQVLIIDDGTKDNSGRIADEFAQRHSRYVTVVHKENGGLSSARNKGLELAKGQYIIFPDPDDYLEKDYIQTIIDTIKTYDWPDLVFFDYYAGSKKKGFKIHTVSGFRQGIISKEKFICEFVKDTNIKSMVWCKAIKKEFYEGLTFNTKTRVAEDYELLTNLVLKVESIVYVSRPLYYYVMREDSLIHTGTLKDVLRFYELCLDRYNKYSLFYKEISFHGLVRAAKSILLQGYISNDEIDLSRYEKIIKDNIINILLDREFCLNEKKQYLLIYFNLAKHYYRAKL